MSNPSKTLEAILKLIDRDVKAIKKDQVTKDAVTKKTKITKLDPADALTLSRYATTLSNISDEQDKSKEKEKQKLDKLTTEQLIELYKQGEKPKKEDPTDEPI